MENKDECIKKYYYCWSKKLIEFWRKERKRKAYTDMEWWSSVDREKPVAALHQGAPGQMTWLEEHWSSCTEYRARPIASGGIGVNGQVMHVRTDEPPENTSLTPPTVASEANNIYLTCTI